MSVCPYPVVCVDRPVKWERSRKIRPSDITRRSNICLPSIFLIPSPPKAAEGILVFKKSMSKTFIFYGVYPNFFKFLLLLLNTELSKGLLQLATAFQPQYPVFIVLRDDFLHRLAARLLVGEMKHIGDVLLEGHLIHHLCQDTDLEYFFI